MHIICIPQLIVVHAEGHPRFAVETHY